MMRLRQVARSTVVYFVVRALFAWKAWRHDPSWLGWHFWEALLFGVTMAITSPWMRRKGRDNGRGQ